MCSRVSCRSIYIPPIHGLITNVLPFDPGTSRSAARNATIGDLFKLLISIILELILGMKRIQLVLLEMLGLILGMMKPLSLLIELPL